MPSHIVPSFSDMRKFKGVRAIHMQRINRIFNHPRLRKLLVKSRVFLGIIFVALLFVYGRFEFYYIAFGVSFLGELSKKYGLPIPAFGHAGDGNIHVNIMLDKSNPEEMKNAESIIKDLFEKVISMGGTITGEHGVGITKAPYMKMEFSAPALDLMKRIKAAFDPNNILNPGKIFPV